MIAAQSAPVTYCYRICGLHLTTPVELCCGAPLGDWMTDADVHIARLPVPECLPDADVRGPNWEVSGSRILLRVPSVLRLLAHGGREISYEHESSVAETTAPLFLAGSGIGAILHQRGEYVLHASAIEVDGGAMVFCGQSGAGKSTLVATLCAAGFPLISDDVCRIQFGRRGPAVVPDGRHLKLWGDSIRQLGLEAFRRGQLRPGIEKYWVEPPFAASTEPLPIRGIYLLHHGDGFSLGRPAVVHAVEQLRAFAYRPRLVKALGQEPLWLNRSAVLATQVPVYQLERSANLDQLDSWVAMLRDHWSRL